MRVLNKFFETYRVNIGPTVVASYRNMVGRIFFYPSECNSFIDDYSCVGVYDNGDIMISSDMGKLLDYTSHRDEFIIYCVDIWNREVLSKGNNQLVLCDRVCSLMDDYFPQRF